MGLIILAFAFGCIATAFIRVAPQNANANSESADTAANSIPAFTLSEVQDEVQKSQLGVSTDAFGQDSAGNDVKKFTCTNSNGYVLELMDYGATIIGMHLPAKDGSRVNVALNCADMAGYNACTSYFGATCGRYCNRIANGKFSLDGKEYTLATNGAPHHLHGGNVAFDKKIWSSELIENEDSVGVRFKLTSPDGDEGYPGEVKVVAEYTLDDENRLKMVFKATTDAATHVNLCNHTYWNIAGSGSGSVMGQEMTLNCDKVVEFDETLIPTGKLLPVEGDSYFDYRTTKTLESGMKAAPAGSNGYDHCFVINRKSTNELALVGSIRDPKSGRKMTMYSTQPGFQLYTSNHFNGHPGSGGFEKHGAVCFETQHYPDTPNHPEFPTTLLKPGDTLVHTTVHQFSVE
jgi:aldose 1-epimerase